jgi:hypothetical protein
MGLALSNDGKSVPSQAGSFSSLIPMGAKNCPVRHTRVIGISEALRDDTLEIIGAHQIAVIDRLRSPVLLFDAAGLGLFSVSSTQKALAFGLHPVMAALLSMLTGISGGMTRYLLLAEIPTASGAAVGA